MPRRLFPDAVGPTIIIPGYSSDTDLTKFEVIANAREQDKKGRQQKDSQYLRTLTIH